ncbi:MAG: dimethyl sulfoxide reductase anchor subunit [Caldilineales bacterium]|nr:dimethyl sulfoxide reductase anchor subunit [Caldilineales bacterium]MCW5856671.1 dimethyl sulfoxide reductase anchor subunit [Caldilineales bacterium]
MNPGPTHQSPWDWRAAMQFICGGAGAGLLLFTALSSLGDPAWLRRGGLLAGLLALVFVGLGLFFVWIKLGRRLRAAYVILNPRTSWMSREALFAGGMGALTLAGLVVQSPPLTLAAALFGLGYLFSQAQMFQTSRGIPAWRQPAITPLFFLTGLAEGGGLFALVALIFGGAAAWTTAALLLLVAARWLAWARYFQQIAAPGAVPVRSLEILSATRRLFVSGGHIAPALLLLLALAAQAALPVAAALLAALAGLLMIASGWYFKFNLITRAAFNQGFALTRTPARAPGHAGGPVKPGW